MNTHVESAGNRVATPVPLTAITATIQVCGSRRPRRTSPRWRRALPSSDCCIPVEASPAGDGTFTMTKGNRRLLARRLLGRDTIPAFVADDPLTETNRPTFVRAQVSENVYRKNARPNGTRSGGS